jgi:hypothetical protein
VEPRQMKEYASQFSLQASDIGDAFRQFGAALANPSWKFEVKSDRIVGRVAIPEVQGVKPVILPLAYLDKDVLIKLLHGTKETAEKEGACPADEDKQTAAGFVEVSIEDYKT